MLDITIPTRPTNCADSDPELFFDPLRIPEAKAVCEGCWFASECAQIGQGEGTGVWAGEAKIPLLEERTEALRESILELYDAGMTRGQIGRELDIGVQSVRRVVDEDRPGVSAQRAAAATKAREERNAVIVELWQQGVPRQEIADRMGIHFHTVDRVVTASGARESDAA